MFGYVRPLTPELRVKENELYRAVYCGLCRTMRKRVSFFASLSLNYDFVFFCLLRALAAGEEFTFVQKRCFAHPTKRRLVAQNDTVLSFVAKLHLALTYEKVCDDLRDADSGFGRRFVLFFYRPLLSCAVRRCLRSDAEFRHIFAPMQDAFIRLRALENSGERDTDTLCHCFGSALEQSCAYGLTGSSERLMRQTAACAGRLIYLLDACDDLEQDAKKNSFNPYLQAYGSPDAALEHLFDIDTVLSLYAGELAADTALFSGNQLYEALCENIAQKGIPTAIKRIVEKSRQKTTKKGKP